MIVVISYFFIDVKIGFLRITDLGIAKIWSSDNANDTSGTPGYMGEITN